MAGAGRGAVLVFAASFAAFAWTATPLSDHPDTLRDWYAARACADHGQCLVAGSTTSFSGLQNGALFPGALAAFAALGLDLSLAWWAVVAGAAVAVLGVWLAAKALGWPGAALGAASAAAVWAACLHAQVLWAPAFAPLLGCVAGLWALAGSTGVGVAWAAGLGLAGGLLTDCHPMAAAAWTGWWLALAIRGPVSACLVRLAVAFGVAAGVGWALAPVAMEDNVMLAVRAMSDRPLAPLLAITALTGLVWAVRRLGRPDTAVLTVAAVVPLAAALYGRIATGHELHPRYLAAAAPAFGWFVAAAWPWSQRVALFASLALCLAAAAVLGRGRVSNGHSWSQLAALAPMARDAGLSWPSAIGQIQGHGCRKLAAGLGGALPWQSPVLASPPTILQVIDLPADATVSAAWSELPRNPASPLRSWARVASGWLNSSRGRVCVRIDGEAERCEPLRPGLTWGPSGEPSVWPDAPLHTRAYPRSTSLRPPDHRASTATVEVALQSPGGDRLLRILDLPGRRCPWRLAAAGDCTVTVAADIARLHCPPTIDGKLRFERRWGPACDDTAQWTDGPPCTLEADPADAHWLSGVAVP